MSRTRWDDMMRLGLGVLRLTPEVFWAMTPGEFERALEGAGVIVRAGQTPMTRQTLNDLLARFPDGTGGSGTRDGIAAEKEG